MTADLMTSREVADFFRRKATKTIREWHRKGLLPATVVLPSGELLWARADVEAFRASRVPAEVKAIAEKAEQIKAQLDAAFARSQLRRGRSA